MCTVLNLAVYLEEFLRRNPGAKYLFTEDDDDGAPERLKSNHRNNMDRHVFKNDEFMAMALESDSHQGLGTHSFRKGAADEARKAGALPDEIEIRGRWKPQGRRVVFRYIDVTQVHIDAKVAAMLCADGPIKYKLKASLVDQITDDWLFTNCVPHIRLRFPNDRRLCRILGLATLYAYCDLTVRELLPTMQQARLAEALVGVNYGVNAVEKVPLHVCSVNGNLCIDELTQDGGIQGQAEGQAAAVGVAPVHGGAANGAILQSILLNQQRCVNQQALLQVQMEAGFANLKQYMDRRFVTLNDNVRRFGGTVQGGFARQDPTQATNRRRAGHEPPLPPINENELAAGVTYRDPTAELTPNLHSLEDLWTEWKFGIGGRKAAQNFTRRERGGHGCSRKKQRFYRRLKVYTLLQQLVDEGDTPAVAIQAIKTAYGEPKSVTNYIIAITAYPNHPSLRHPPRRRRGDPAPAPPPPRAPPARRGRGRGRGRGVPVAQLPGQRQLGPMFRPPTVPRLPDTQLGLQAELNRQLMGDGPGGPNHVMFQNPTIRAEI